MRSTLNASDNRFRARRGVVDEHRIRELKAAGGRAIPPDDFLLLLEDHLAMSIRRTDRPFPMFKLQGNMLGDLIDAEKAVAAYKAQVAELEAAKAAEDEVDIARREWRMHQHVRTAIRDVGDGMAWRLLSFDRFALAQLALRPRKQHINLEGLGAELYELGEAFNAYGRVAILNDLTHYLKKGDITARVDDTNFEFIEVKSSNTKSSKIIRQRADLLETVQFLNERGKTVEGEALKALSVAVKPRSYMHVVDRALSRAEQTGFASERIGDHLAIFVLDWDAGARHGIDISAALKPHGQIVDGWAGKGDLVLDLTNVDRYAHVQNVAPFSIYPLPHRHRVKLATAAFWVISTLNISAVLRYLSKRGWETIKEPRELVESIDCEKSVEVPVALLRKRPLTIGLPMTLVGRLANEFLALPTLADVLDAVVAAGRHAADGLFINLADEATLWD